HRGPREVEDLRDGLVGPYRRPAGPRAPNMMADASGASLLAASSTSLTARLTTSCLHLSLLAAARIEPVSLTASTSLRSAGERLSRMRLTRADTSPSSGTSSSASRAASASRRL